MKIFKATRKADTTIVDNPIKHIAVWGNDHFKLFVNGEKTALFSIELSRNEIERIIEVYITGKSK